MRSLIVVSAFGSLLCLALASASWAECSSGRGTCATSRQPINNPPVLGQPYGQPYGQLPV